MRKFIVLSICVFLGCVFGWVSSNYYRQSENNAKGILSLDEAFKYLEKCDYANALASAAHARSLGEGSFVFELSNSLVQDLVRMGWGGQKECISQEGRAGQLTRADKPSEPE